ncbi:MAG: hypothetical protein CSA55_05365 [Ilumatobacter coccineus]|uniref:Uncharacterized protein n=1 Tax=Ilumatobacter coccineus TaxID=467094 RepID=A0A2G6K7F7_9ACTN|nr:MAG: hypothetical protein CSA55_05365 [Ilumatobacter coccineus]
MALVGAVIGIIGLFMKALTSPGADALPAVSEAVKAQDPNAAVPESLPTIWSGLDTWAKVVLVLMIIAVVALAVTGIRSALMGKAQSSVVAAIGVVLFVYAIVKWMEASDKASDLAGVFAQMNEAGAVPEAYSVSPGVIGFALLWIGTALVAVGGGLGLRSKSS